MKNCTPLWREAHLQVKMYKTPGLGALLEVEMSKSARRCGAKHILNSKSTKHTRCGPLLAVEMSKKCTPLWREAHLEVKMLKKKLGVRTTFGGSDVEKVHAVVARSTFGSQNVKNTRGSDHFWKFRCRFASLHYITLHYITLHYTPLHYITLHYLPLHFTTLHYTPLHYNYNYDYTTTLHYTKITLHYATLHYTTLHSTTLHSTILHYTTLHYTE